MISAVTIGSVMSFVNMACKSTLTYANKFLFYYLLTLPISYRKHLSYKKF